MTLDGRHTYDDKDKNNMVPRGTQHRRISTTVLGVENNW
jgi:hypothetical protein